MRIFVHSASEFFTDYEAHGDGRICYSLINGLAQRGHQIFLYTRKTHLKNAPLNTTINVNFYKPPIISIDNWYHNYKSNQWFKSLGGSRSFDIVWRLHPYQWGCPNPPRTDHLPLVVGPIYYEWPKDQITEKKNKKWNLKKILEPIAQQGWEATLRKSSLLIGSTPKHREKLKKLYPNHRIIDLPVIVDPPKTIQRNNEHQSFKLIFVANLISKKNPELFCNIISKLVNLGYTIEAKIIGDGPLKNEIDDMIVRNHLKKHIELVGRKNPEEVFQFLSLADLFISTSYGEPYGRTIVESLAVGTPCLVHRSGGPAEYLTHEENCLMADQLTTENYIYWIQQILENKKLWQKLSLAGLTQAQAWTSLSVITHLESTFHEVIEGKN